MKYEESNLVELKRLLDDDMKSEIISFLNSYIGGTIYVGVDDDGSVYPLSISQKDENESKIINWIRDEAIYPNCSDYVKFHYNEDDVLEINIESGKEKPYYLKSKGLKPSGVYIRYGRNKAQATQQEIARMIRERDDIPYESLISKNQNLTFITLKNKFEEKGMDFGNFKLITSGFIIDGKYTNVAYWFSDQYQVETKMAVYQGLSRNIFRSKKEYDGCIISQIDHALDYFDLCNEIRVVINGDPTRKEIPSYKKRAAREAILNCYCHRDFSRRSNIKIEFFDDRLEILSPGGFYDGLTLEKALNGEQSFRNEYVVRLLYKLGYIENYASGLTRIFDEYAFELDEPQIITSDTSFKVVLPNKNYNALYKQPQNHIKDNNVEYDISGLFHKKE
ncbi:MAG: putative DNA binding domain-containing protein [Erysipelotrichaceae bacterium]|nr:putative DNA binding domain-containing protein [Erysipelotrichaceae bacterium]